MSADINNLSFWKVAKDFIKYYKKASNEEILFVLNDKPLCFYGGIHQAVCKPFALREAKKRKIL